MDDAQACVIGLRHLMVGLKPKGINIGRIKR